MENEKIETETETAASESSVRVEAPAAATLDPEVVVDRIKWMTKPGPVPAGHIAVELPKVGDGWFLVRLDERCGECGGDGLNHKPEGEKRLPYCETCVLAPIALFVDVYNTAIRVEREEEAALERAEKSDASLRKRLEAAEARVAELEKAKVEALAEVQKKRDDAAEEIKRLRARAVVLGEQKDEYKRRLEATNKGFADKLSSARAVHMAKIQEVHEELARRELEIRQDRDTYAREHNECLEKLAQEEADNVAKKRAAEETLQRAASGPDKVARRWDEKLKPARVTLERLKRRYDS